MKKLFLLIILAGALLTSCKKCKDCTVAVDLDNDFALTDSDCNSLYGMDCETYLTQGYSAAEYCDDELETIENTADATGDGWRVYWDCK